MFDTATLQNAFFSIIALFVAGAFGSLLFYGRSREAAWWGNGVAIAASFATILFSVAAFVAGGLPVFGAPASFPGLALSFHIDKLSAFFLGIIALTALFSSVYGLGYVKHYAGKYDIGVLGFFYNAFILGMLLVVSADNIIFFLIAWEVMTLASYFLVIFEHRDESNIKAGIQYFVMAHVGTAFIVLALVLLGKTTGSFGFEGMRAGAQAMTPLIKDLVFLASLIGFGVKSGIIPLHIWLPSAHPAAPSHVSALMSGVMIKTGIYMMIRIFFDILPASPSQGGPATPLWWGLFVLLIASVSSVLGVLYALSEHDLKRLLAYHSIENIGIILLGVGSALVFQALGAPGLALVGLTAALFHTLNHAVFKALLFLSAGSVISEMHTRNIEEYGGLLKYMPVTGFFFLIGSLAISGFPPFNGFASEWLTFQSLFSGIGAGGAVTTMVFVIAAGALAFTGGLAAACFAKAFGSTFLARPRGVRVRHTKEASLSLQVGMASLAALTLVLGVFAGGVSKILASVAGSVGSLRLGEASSLGSGSFSGGLTAKFMTVGNGFGAVSMPFVATFLMVALAFVLGGTAILTRRRRAVTGATWSCGSALNPKMEITPTGFSRSIVVVLRGVLRPTQQTETEYHDANLRYFPSSRTVHLHLQDVYRLYLYRPFHKLLMRLSGQAKRVQTGNLNVYLLYIFFVLIGLLIIATL